jgi:hypothetical protein
MCPHDRTVRDRLDSASPSKPSWSSKSWRSGWRSWDLRTVGLPRLISTLRNPWQVRGFWIKFRMTVLMCVVSIPKRSNSHPAPRRGISTPPAWRGGYQRKEGPHRSFLLSRTHVNYDLGDSLKKMCLQYPICPVPTFVSDSFGSTWFLVSRVVL